VAEETGFEPPVPRRIDDAFETALFASAALPVPPERPTRFARGTGGSNPASSSGESGANLISGRNAIAGRRGVRVVRFPAIAEADEAVIPPARDIDGETGRQRRSARTLDRDEMEPYAGIALNHEPDPPGTKYADPVEQDEPIGNVVEAPRHPSLAHPILHRQSRRRPTRSWSTLLASCCAHKLRGPVSDDIPRRPAEMLKN